MFIALNLAYQLPLVLLADRVTRLVSRPRVRRAVDVITGTVLVGFGIRLATEQLAGSTDRRGVMPLSAGVTQSVVSAYESGRRQPSVAMLAALVAATGFELDLQLRTTPPRLDALTCPVGRRVRRRRRRLLDTAAVHGIHDVQVFGSVARGEDRPDSDLDLLVDLPDGMGLIGLDLRRRPDPAT